MELTITTLADQELLDIVIPQGQGIRIATDLTGG